MLTDSWLRRVWTPLSIALFLAMAAAHLTALTALFVGQIIVIMAFRLGRTVGEQLDHAWWWVRNHWKAVRLGTKLVPRGWLALMLVLWFLYLPGMFFGGLAASGGREMSDRWSTVMISLFYGVFFLVHYLLLRFIIPRKAEILAQLEAPE